MVNNGKIVFMPAQVGRAGEDVALQIEAAILDGRIQPGESLPSERELQAQFQTGRGVIREALKSLKQKGLIETRKGTRGGAFVKQMDVALVSESLSLFLKQNPVDPSRLIEFRESLDRTIAQLAISRATQGEKDALVTAAEAFETALGAKDVDQATLGEMDRNLNIQFAKMTHNPLFEFIMRAMQLGFSSHDYALYEDPEFREKTISNWRDTAVEIRNNEPLKALSCIGYHYVLLQRCIDEKKQTTALAADAAGTDA
ncbi:MAG: GntR family transcriptional regulator [Deltaproteobacteria bacterium]|nr:MAG: GntR family transcriptional regulator [Deltaproteobacteria bacterium]